LTSYFVAWLNNQNIHGRKKFVVAYTPKLAMIKENMDLFFEIYPDGRLIAIIRDPGNWLLCAFKYNLKKGIKGMLIFGTLFSNGKKVPLRC
jgi:hypothetical protein